MDEPVISDTAILLMLGFCAFIGMATGELLYYIIIRLSDPSLYGTTGNILLYNLDAIICGAGLTFIWLSISGEFNPGHMMSFTGSVRNILITGFLLIGYYIGRVLGMGAELSRDVTILIALIFILGIILPLGLSVTAHKNDHFGEQA